MQECALLLLHIAIKTKMMRECFFIHQYKIFHLGPTQRDWRPLPHPDLHRLYRKGYRFKRRLNSCIQLLLEIYSAGWLWGRLGLRSAE